jgi:hypothetical protein
MASIVLPGCSVPSIAAGTILNGIAIDGIESNASWRMIASPSFGVIAKTTPCTRSAFADTAPGRTSMQQAMKMPTIHGYKAGRMNASDRDAALIRREWRRSERSIVLHGFFGRLVIAIEPILCGTMFLALTIGMLIVKTDPHYPAEHNMVILSPIFALGVVACICYALILMWNPTRALIQTFRPIYIVDGYVRYRGTDSDSPVDSNGYVAVLTETQFVACEWATIGDIPLRDLTQPALTEFSEYGGVHRIDGRPTGVLPDRIARLGVGIISRREIIP